MSGYHDCKKNQKNSKFDDNVDNVKLENSWHNFYYLTSNVDCKFPLFVIPSWIPKIDLICRKNNKYYTKFSSTYEYDKIIYEYAKYPDKYNNIAIQALLTLYKSSYICNFSFCKDKYGQTIAKCNCCGSDLEVPSPELLRHMSQLDEKGKYIPK